MLSKQLIVRVNEMSDDFESPTLFGKKKVRVIGIREDWAMIPLGIFTGIDFFWVIYDFVILQNLIFQPFFVTIGLPLLIIGAIYRTWALLYLNKEAIGDAMTVKILQISEDHKLVTDRYYEHIRYSSYLGMIVFVLGYVIMFSSLYGFILLSVGTIFIHFRMNTEEKMLLEHFGEEYEEYRSRTKRLIPRIY
jgi:protein-S-isoprenylcysteine O-methyltransferase Ste14